MATNQLLKEKEVYTLDLDFMGFSGAIAAYLIPHSSGVVLVECGPGSTIPALISGLKEFELTPADITDVLLTHIHLDHAGAAGWLARQGARVHVHPVGAPHLRDPRKLLESAGRIYGDMMEPLWGEFLPVPAESLSIPDDEIPIEVHGLRFIPLDTPGHANHHYAYLYENTCFSGDIAAVRMTGLRHLRLPMPPPEFHLEKWRASLKRLRDLFAAGEFSRIAPTHFGIFEDPGWHLAELARDLDEVEAWMEAVMPADPDIESLNEKFLEWTQQRSAEQGLEKGQIETYEAANPSWMSGYGIQRYWRKYRS